MESNICANAAADVNIQNGILENEKWNKRRLARNARKRERRQKQKSEDPAKYKEECEKRRKSENPEYVKEESKKRKERRQKQKLENPESHSDFLASEKQKRENLFKEELNDLFDSLFHENKHSFPTPVSKTLWQKLKNTEIDFLLYSPVFSLGEITIRDLHIYRQNQLDFLRENIDFPHGGSVIFYIKTMVHRPRDQRIITKDEIDYINSLILPDFTEDDIKVSRRKKYYEKNKSREIAAAKSSYETKKSNQKSHNLNIRFMKEDPNRVLSLDDICHNPYVSNFCQREAYKINLWKNDKNPKYLEKWRKQREIYEKEVSDLSIEYKENFLKNKWQAQS